MTHNPRLGKYEAYDPETAPLDVERVRLFFHMQQEAGVYGSPVCLHLHDRTPPCVERANQFVAEYARGAVPALQATPEPPDALVDRIGTRMQATGEGEPNDNPRLRNLPDDLLEAVEYAAESSHQRDWDADHQGGHTPRDWRECPEWPCALLSGRSE